MKTLSGLNKMLNEGRFLQQLEKVATKHKGEGLPFAELKSSLKALAVSLSNNAELLDTKPDHLAGRVWEACEGDVLFRVMDCLAAMLPLGDEHEEIGTLLQLPVFGNQEVLRAYAYHVLQGTVNSSVQEVSSRQPTGTVHWRLGFTVGDQAVRPVLLMSTEANAAGEFDRLEVGALYPVGTLRTVMEQAAELQAAAKAVLDDYLADPANWVSPEREVSATRNEMLTLIASLDKEQKAMLKRLVQKDPTMLQQALAAAA